MAAGSSGQEEGNKSRRKMAAEGDELLIQEVKSRPILYDIKRKDYRDIEQKMSAWVEIGSVLERKAEECRHRWKCLRERYVREKKAAECREQRGSEAPNASPAERPWPLMEAMSFLRPLVVHRSLRVKRSSVLMGNGLISVDMTQGPLSVGESPPVGGVELVSVNGGCYSATMDSPPEDEHCPPMINSVGTSAAESPCPTSSSASEVGGPESGICNLASRLSLPSAHHHPPQVLKSPRKRRKASSSSCSVATQQMLSLDHLQEEVLMTLRADRERGQQLQRQDEDDLFCLSIAAGLRKLPLQQKFRAKIKILEVFQDLS